MMRGQERMIAGMTLLELLLAVTVLASVMALIGTMLGQSAQWNDENTSAGEELRLERVVEAMRAQWADRRTLIKMDQMERPYKASPDTLVFTTATPLLFPQWPLVVVEYRIEADPNHTSASGLLLRLVYEETRLSSVDELPERHALDTEGRPMRDTMVLLEGCKELVFERFGRGKRVEDEAESEEEVNGTEGSLDGAESEEEKAERDERERDRWRVFEDDYKGRIPAVRLIGEYEGERFGWVFVAQALH